MVVSLMRTLAGTITCPKVTQLIKKKRNLLNPEISQFGLTI